MKISKYLIGIGVLSIGLLISSCGLLDSQKKGEDRIYKGSGAVGDVVTFTIDQDKKTIRVTNAETNEDFSGTYVVQSDGSYLITYNGETFRAWEIPGVLMAAVIPRNDNGDKTNMLSVAAAQGVHDRSALVGDYNFISMKAPNQQGSFYGTYNVTVDSGITHTSYSVSDNVKQEGEPKTEPESSFTFNGSEFKSTNPQDTWTAYITEKGVFIIDFSEGSGGIVGAPLATPESIDGEFLVITGDGNIGTVSVQGTAVTYSFPDDNGSMTVSQIFPGIYQGDVPSGPRITFTILPGKAFFGNYRNNDGSHGNFIGMKK